MYLILYAAIEKKEHFDLWRNFNLFLTGSVYLGPCLHFWYSKYLPRLVSNLVSSQGKFKPAFVGMLLDQIVFAPIFLSGFFVFAGFV